MTNPLADRIRPESLEQVVGQQHLLGPGKALRQLIESGDIPNLIFYGPPGVGKTTVASIIAKRTDRALRRLNGTNASTADIRALVAELDTLSAPNGILLYLDEIQYFNKRQQQSLPDTTAPQCQSLPQPVPGPARPAWLWPCRIRRHCRWYLRHCPAPVLVCPVQMQAAAET